jgi:hypothetical protein
MVILVLISRPLVCLELLLPVVSVRGAHRLPTRITLRAHLSK